MKRFVLGLGCVAGLLLPSIASAALSLSIGPKKGTGASAIDAAPAPGQQSFDLIFTESGATENEGLFAYDLLLTVPTAMRDKIALGGGEKPDNFVLDVASGSTFTVAENAADHVLINISSNNDLADITTGKKAAKIFYTLTPLGLAAAATSPLSVLGFDTGSTVFGSGDPNRQLEIVVDLTDVGVVGVPEPTGMALLGVAGLLALRRRRTA